MARERQKKHKGEKRILNLPHHKIRHALGRPERSSSQFRQPRIMMAALEGKEEVRAEITDEYSLVRMHLGRNCLPIKE